MILDFKNLPTGSLPYDNISLCKQMMLRLYKNVPFLPELPMMDTSDTLFNRTFSNISCIEQKDGKIFLPDNNNDKFVLELLKFDKIVESDNIDYYNLYGTSTPFFDLYLEFLKKFNPEYTIIELMGPFTFANSVFNQNASTLLTGREYRKFITEAFIIKAIWFINKIKQASLNTKPIILFNENLLYKYGTLKRTNESITKETITTLLTKIFKRIQKAGGLIGVQSFEKCNWQLILDTECVNLISFDAYNNSSSLNLIAGSINQFLIKGGYINWGIVPTMNELTIRNLNVDALFLKLRDSIEELATKGVSLDLLYKNSTISVQGNLAKYPILFAEKALIIANQLSKKIPASSANYLD